MLTCVNPTLDRPVILFQDVIKILNRSVLTVLFQNAISFELNDGWWISSVLADKIRDVSTEKPTEVSPVAKLSAAISGRVYRFPPNEINVKSLSLILVDPQPHYEIEAYARDATKSDPRFNGPIGLDGLYRKGEPTRHGLAS